MVINYYFQPGLPDFSNIVPQDARNVFSRPLHSFAVSMSMILISELGDKTFIVAALMAMQHPRLTIFVSAFLSLALMSFLSAAIGHVAEGAIGRKWTALVAGILFLVFGFKLLIDGYKMSTGYEIVKEEIVQVEQELRDHDEESGQKKEHEDVESKVQHIIAMCASPAFAQTFVMTFLSEWGDRSQIATIVMASGPYFWWVTLGAIAGHAVCTGIAVLGGRLLASRISMRKITIGAAFLFMVFGVLYLHEASLHF